ncbi:MAG: hypothetical protein K2R98_15720 [Gemmataceae bacterium]|nr:hypothetical protein [Gemmataceae bacterium]
MAKVCEQVQVGQTVTLRELEYGFEVAVLPAGQSGLVVIEATADYIVMEEPDVVTRVPTFLIKNVTGVVPAVPSEPAPEVIAQPASEIVPAAA